MTTAERVALTRHRCEHCGVVLRVLRPRGRDSDSRSLMTGVLQAIAAGRFMDLLKFEHQYRCAAGVDPS